MKKYLFLFVFLFSPQVFAQTQIRDVVYLKNGSIIKGQITEMNPSENLKIETADGSLFVYKMGEILKMEKETFAGTQMNENRTQSSVNISILSNHFQSYFSQPNRNLLKFVDVSKKNGIEREINGQKVYAIEYELLLEPKQDIFVSDVMSIYTDGFSKTFGYLTKQPTGWNSYMNSDAKKINKGQRIIANGTINLEETDNGWRVSGFDNRNYKTVSSSYVTENMALAQKDKIAAYEKAGDWNQADLSELPLNPIYLKSASVPIFENSSVQYIVKKMPQGCYDCRNDNIISMQNSLKKAISRTSGYSVSNSASNFGVLVPMISV